MADETERVAVSDLEELIEQLPGVLRCQVVTNDWGGIEAVHVLSSLERSPKQTVRDIESALLARWHLRVDRKKISVAQVAAGRPQGGEAPRLRVAGWEVEHDAARGRVTATVLLAAAEGETVIRGEYRGAYIPSQQPLP
ncbi:MAG: hypothetical protein OWV35_05205, partial [Firmicutes bacterium]|nr:hypothetical protein [Bacillota bacterium]